MIIVVCAWCGLQCGCKGNPGHTDIKISHGICEPCAAKVLQQDLVDLAEEKRRAA